MDELIKSASEHFPLSEKEYARQKAEDGERWEEYQRTGKYIPHAIVSAWLKDLAAGKVAKITYPPIL